MTARLRPVPDGVTPASGRAAACVLVGALCLGCAVESRSVAYDSIAELRSSDAMELKVELMLDKLRHAEIRLDPPVYFPPLRIVMGQALTEHATALAHSLFDGVVVPEDPWGPADEVDGTLLVELGSVSVQPPPAAFTSGQVSIEIVWTLTDPGGAIVWQDRIVGVADSRWGHGLDWHSDAERDVKAAVEDAFSNSYLALSSAKSIRTLASRREGEASVGERP